MAVEDWLFGEEADERYEERFARRKQMAQVEVDVEETEVTSDSGRILDGVKVTCSRCGHEVEVCGTTDASVKRGCAMLRDECPLGERNFYVGGCARGDVTPRAKMKTAVANEARVLPPARTDLAKTPVVVPPTWLTGDQPMYLIFDTETTGIPAGSDHIHLVQLAWQLFDDNQEVRNEGDFIVRPDGFTIPPEVAKIHGITQARAMTEGRPLDNVLCLFTAALYFPIRLVGHNLDFDIRIVRKEFERLGWADELQGKETLCTMRSGTDLCAIEKKGGGGWKAPKLGELHRKLFREDYANAHTAMGDVRATARCFWELRRMGRI